MNLVDAFNGLRPGCGEEVATTILTELERLARREVRDLEAAEEIAHEKLCSLLRGRSRPRKVPTTEREVRGYLRKAVLNHLKDQHKRRTTAREHATPIAIERLAASDQQDLLDHAAKAERIAAARDVFDDSLPRLAERVAKTLRGTAGETLRESVRDMIAIARGAKSIPDVAAALEKNEQDIHSRHYRARRQLLEAVQGEERAGSISPIDAEHIRLAIDILRGR